MKTKGRRYTEKKLAYVMGNCKMMMLMRQGGMTYCSRGIKKKARANQEANSISVIRKEFCL